MSHVIVDSEYCFTRYRESAPSIGEMYYTTSPYLLNASPFKESFRSLEANLNRTELDNLSKATYDIGTDFSRALNELCSWRDYADLNIIFAGSIQRCVNAIFYKAFLLQEFFETIGAGETITCVGDSGPLRQDGLELQFGRFDALFVHLAERTTSASLSIYHCELPKEECDRQIKFVKERRFGALEKLLSIINNTPSSFCYKVLKNVARKSLSTGSIRIALFPRKHIYLYKDSDVAEELFLSLLFQGASLGFLPRLPESKMLVQKHRDEPSNQLSTLLLECARKRFRDRGAGWGCFHDAAAAIAAERIGRAIDLLRANLAGLTEQFEIVSKRLQPQAEILTNSFSSAIQRLYACYCKANGIKTLVVEHGLTTGFSEYSKYREAHSVMTAGDVGIYHSDIAVRQMELHAPNQEKLIVGLPAVMAEVKLPRLQRLLARKFLGLERRTELVVYVCDLERNNYYFGPHTDTDYDYVFKTKCILRLLTKMYPNARICLKLYPATRYFERYCFEDIVAEIHQVMVPEDIDFRFIRAAADHIFTTSSLSTLGWVLGSGKPYTFIEVPWSPVTFSARFSRLDQSTGFKFMEGGLDIKVPVLRPSRDSRQLLSI